MVLLCSRLSAGGGCRRGARTAAGSKEKRKEAAVEERGKKSGVEASVISTGSGPRETDKTERQAEAAKRQGEPTRAGEMEKAAQWSGFGNIHSTER